MQSYFGGRAECRIRNWEVPVCPVDFMSQYPTVNELLDNWAVLTAENVTFPMRQTKYGNFFRRSRLNVALTASSGRNSNSSPSFARTTTFSPCAPSTTARPKILESTTSRAKNRFGLQGLTLLPPFLLTGARFRISKKQSGSYRTANSQDWVQPLCAAWSKVDANKNSFFKHVIEQRARHESEPSTSLLAEDSRQQRIVRPVRGTQSERSRMPSQLKVFSGEESFRNHFGRCRRAGKLVRPAHRFSYHIRWSPASGDARKVHRGCRGHITSSVTPTAQPSCQPSTDRQSRCPTERIRLRRSLGSEVQSIVDDSKASIRTTASWFLAQF